MRINDLGLQIVKNCEGLRLSAYQDPIGIWSIGYGHRGGVNAATPAITEAQAEDLLRRDLHVAEETVTELVNVPLNTNQFSALCSLVYNIGAGAFGMSTLLALLNRREYQLAADQFFRWDHAGGKTLPGLTARRILERLLFLTSVSPPTKEFP